jgi:hypothetical protein
MKTLGELLEGETLPVRVELPSFPGEWFEVHYIHDGYAFGHNQDHEACRAGLRSDRGYLIVEPKRPRLLAWRCTDVGSDLHRMIKLAPSDEVPPKTNWKRVPHLDEPEAQ